MENRQPKCRFGHKCVAPDRLKGLAGGVACSFEIPRYHPDLPLNFQADLGRSEDVPGRMQRNAYTVMLDGLAVRQGLQVDLRS